MRKALLLLGFLLYLISCAQQTEKSTTMNRKPAVAGKFYPANKIELLAQVKDFLSNAEERKSDAIAVISPHAGYVFSGNVAASAINQLNPDKKYDNVFIIGTSHTTYFKGASVYCSGNFLSPLGEVKVNTELAKELIKKNAVLIDLPEAHETEHSIEVQLPFLQVHLKNDFQIVPIVIGQDGINTAKELARVLKPYFNEKNAFIISSDFTHYPSYDDAVKIDKETAEAIVTGNPENLIKHIERYENTKVHNLATTCCGWSSILTLMYLTDSGCSYHLIEYKNSGDSPYGGKDRVVGYWAISVVKHQPDAFQLSDDEKLELLKLARKTIEHRLTKGEKPDVKNIQITENLKKHCWAFFTLHKK